MNTQQSVQFHIWRMRLDAITNDVFPSNHKLVASHLEIIFITTEKSKESGLWKVAIGKVATRNNLIGRTGLSDWTIRTCIDEMVLNFLLVKKVYHGTPEEMYLDASLFLKPTDKWLKGEFAIKQKSVRRKRKMACPQCHELLPTGTYQIICKHCGSVFEKPEWRDADG